MDAGSTAPPPVPPPAQKITYNLTVFPMGENTKDLKKRCGKGVFLKLSSDRPFDTWKAQVLVKIDATLHPDTIVFEDYEVVFSVPHVSPTPLAITNEEGYAELIQHAMKSKNYEANIYIQQLAPAVKKVRHLCLSVSIVTDQTTT